MLINLYHKMYNLKMKQEFSCSPLLSQELDITTLDMCLVLKSFWRKFWSLSGSVYSCILICLFHFLLRCIILKATLPYFHPLPLFQLCCNTCIQICDICDIIWYNLHNLKAIFLPSDCSGTLKCPKSLPTTRLIWLVTLKMHVSLIY